MAARHDRARGVDIVPVVAANRIGVEEGQRFYGSSFIADPRGEKWPTPSATRGMPLLAAFAISGMAVRARYLEGYLPRLGIFLAWCPGVWSAISAGYDGAPAMARCTHRDALTM
jgi:hypothetical protein